tara:strand:+ start:180 stop:893 length:714 start_codon:yes stop_codon:yes gene_type:complete
MSSTTEQQKLLHSQSVWKIYFGAVLQDIREPNWREEEKEQYKKVCDEDDCDTILDIYTDIMCYMNKNNGDKTLCRECYEDGDYIEDDENSDNEDSDDEEEEENTCWCEVGEHRVSELDMWKDFADCKNCVSEKEMLERTVDDEEEEEEEEDKLDMKILGFITTERLNGDWNSLLFEIRNHEFDDEEEEENTCWGNNKCERDEFGCCIVCCECRECIKRIKEKLEQEMWEKTFDDEEE